MSFFASNFVMFCHFFKKKTRPGSLHMKHQQWEVRFEKRFQFLLNFYWQEFNELLVFEHYSIFPANICWSLRHLQDVLKASRKTSSRCLGRRKIVTLKTSWRCYGDKQNVYWGYLYLTNLYLTNIYLTHLRWIQNTDICLILKLKQHLYFHN